MILYLAYPTSLALKSANALQTYNMVRALKRLTSVRLVVPRLPGRPSRFEELDAIHLPRVPFNVVSNLVRWPLWPFLERATYSWFVRLYLALDRQAGPDKLEAIYVRDVVVAGTLAPWARQHGIPLIYELHHLEADNPSGGRGLPGHGLALACEGAAMAEAAGIVTLTEHAARDVLARWPQLSKRLKVVPDAYDEETFRPIPRESARQELGIPSSVFLVAYTGLTFAHRNVDLMVRAAALLSDIPDLMLAIVGGRQAERAELQQLAQQLRLRDSQVIFPGQLAPHQTALWMAAADVLVLCGLISPRASSPLKLFEYLAMGRPIVAVDVPAVREVLNHENALFFAEGDVAALANALRDLQGTPHLRDSMGRANLLKACRYTYRSRAEAIYSFVKEIVS